ncbi:MAG: hypothetical protein BGO49_15120 [Planctomycetales bacterium 71-10]|nr:MAG: hypothetical protein BGO49_15120 [Planctomycetales bacterium 71-10]
MNQPNARSRDGNSSTPARRARPAVEGLEERLLLYATLGANWVYGSRITYSFVPDGTSVGGTPSVLYQSMNARFWESTWQVAFQRAAAIWQAVANINLVQVSDNGMAFGEYGNQQGDSRVGDIRIGAIPMGSGTLGAAFAPPQINGGTLAGDIVLNSTTPWMINANYDLQTVAIHEFGHALGMDHSAIYNAVMYSYYVGMKQSLNSDDVGGIQSIYSARPYDAWNSNGQSNGVYWNTKSLDGWRNGLNQITVPNLNITTSGQNEWFWVTIPANNTGSFTVQMQSSGLSSLSPQVYVYDSSLNLKGTAAAYGFGDTATITIPGVSSGQGFFIRLSASSGGGAGTGAFGMQVNFGSNPLTPFSPPYTVVASRAGTGGGFVAMTANAGEEPDDDLLRIGTLTAKGDALSVWPSADPTATVRAFATPAPAPGLRATLNDRQDVSASWRYGLWTSIGFLDEALSAWGLGGDDDSPAFGKRAKAQKPA